MLKTLKGKNGARNIGGWVDFSTQGEWGKEIVQMILSRKHQ